MYNNYKEGAEDIEVVAMNLTSALSKGKLIGKNTDYIFLEKSDKSVTAIPVNSDVQEIVISEGNYCNQ